MAVDDVEICTSRQFNALNNESCMALCVTFDILYLNQLLVL